MAPQPLIVIGAGPVGLAAALLLARKGFSIDVYEGRPDIPRDNSNSYPIGVNPRGQKTLEDISPKLLEAMKAQGRVVEGFKIMSGTKQVADMKSGTIIGTTRGDVNSLLYDEALSSGADNIRVHFNHKAKALDLALKTITFETPAGDVVVDASGGRVIAADGVWSSARRAMEEQLSDFKPEVGEWGVKFRVLMSKPGAKAPKLDPDYHYITGPRGVYSAIIAGTTWVLSLTIKPGVAEEPLLTSTEATPENVAALKKYVQEFAPNSAPLLEEEDYPAFFSRKWFTGAVVRVPRVNHGEWLVLLGDAAHSVIPPTGEGVNSGLEDCTVLSQTLSEVTAGGREGQWFAAYNDARLPDLKALGAYAWYLMEGLRATDPVKQGSQLMVMILLAIGKQMGLVKATVEDSLFGPRATERLAYRDVCGAWQKQVNGLLPFCTRVVRFFTFFSRR